MEFTQLTQSQSRQISGDVGASQQNAVIFSQPESVLTQKACLDQLLKEILDSKQDELTMDSETAVKLLGVILKTGLNFSNKRYTKVLDVASTSEITKSLDAIKRLILLVPGILSTEMDNEEGSTMMYESLLERILALFAFNSRSLNTQVGFFIKSMLVATSSTAELRKLAEKIQLHLLQTCDHVCQFLDTRESELNGRTDELLQNLSNLQALELSLTILQAFLRAISSSNNFDVIFSKAKCLQLNSIASKLWLHIEAIKSPNTPEVTTLHLIFANTCSLALSSISGKQFWFPLSMDWLFYSCRLVQENSLVPDVDLAAASLVLDLMEAILKFNSSAFFIKNRDLAKLDVLRIGTLAKRYYVCQCLLALPFLSVQGDPSTRYSQMNSYLTFENTFLKTKSQQILRLLKDQVMTSDVCLERSEQFQLLFDAPFISQPITCIMDLKTFMETSFINLSEAQCAWVVKRIGSTCCLLKGCLNLESLECSNGELGSNSFEAVKFGPTYRKIFLWMIRCQQFQESVSLRLQGLIAFRHIMFCMDFEFEIHSGDEIGGWLIRCFKSTSRQLRLATTSLLPYCMKSDVRRQDIFNLLSSINFSNEMYLSETVLQAWGQLAHVVEGERLNLILMKLIESLGSEISMHSSFAFYQIQSIARNRKTTCWNLMSPFWPSIIVSVLKRHESHPQILQRLMKLFGITQKEFFSQTHRYAVPYMVLTRHKEVLEMIADALEWPIEKLLFQNISKTVAVLLLHESLNIGVFVMQSLSEVHNSIKNLDLAQVVNPNRLDIAFEVLKLHDADDEKKSQRITIIFQFLEDLLYRKDRKKSTAMQPGEYFFDVNILGVVTPFSIAIRGTGRNLPYTEKVQCLSGISKLITCSGNSFAKSVPQICALLQAAMETSELQWHAMKAWFDMIKVMKSADLERVMDLTFSVIIQKWETMTEPARVQSRQLLDYLFTEERNAMKFIIQSKGVPYYSGLLPDLKSIYDEICSLQRPHLLPLGQLKLLLKRGLDDNIYIVRQTVQEISEFLIKEQECIKQSLATESSRTIISSLLRLLLNIPNKFQNTNSDIAYLCSQCIGFLGAIDPSKVDVGDDTPRFLVIHNYDDARESIKFVLHFVEHHLLKGFEASTNPYYQSFLAFGIQEYLKFCNLQLNTLTISPQIEYWEKLSHKSKTMLYPLLSSKYTVSHSTTIPDVEYPIYSDNISHSKWLQSFTMDLLGKVTGANATRIFKLCRKIIKDQDLSIFNFVLPYITLNVVLSGTSSDRHNIVNELLNILNTDLGDSQHGSQQKDNLKRSYSSVFSIVDYFNQTLRAREAFLTAKRNEREKEKINKKAQPKTANIVTSHDENDEQIKLIKAFLQEISANLLAKRSFECKSYSRSLMYWEGHLRGLSEDKEREEIFLRFMEIYASIDDPDSLDGIAANYAFLEVPEKILLYENTGKWDYALECYEVLSKTSEWNVELNSNMLRCIKESGRYEDLLARLDTFCLEAKEMPNDLLCLGIEAAWLAAELEKLKTWLSRVPLNHPVGSTFEVSIGRAIIALSESNFNELWIYIDTARRSVSKILESSPVTSVMQAQDAMIKLHGLADLESIGSLANSSDRSVDLLTSVDGDLVDHRTMSQRLNERLEILGANYDARRYLLALRRSAMKATK